MNIGESFENIHILQQILHVIPPDVSHFEEKRVDFMAKFEDDLYQLCGLKLADIPSTFNEILSEHSVEMSKEEEMEENSTSSPYPLFEQILGYFSIFMLI